MAPKRALSSPPAITGLLDSVSFFLPAFAPSIAALFVSPSEQCQTLLFSKNRFYTFIIPYNLFQFLILCINFVETVREIVRLLHRPVIGQLQLVKLSLNVQIRSINRAQHFHNFLHQRLCFLLPV